MESTKQARLGVAVAGMGGRGRYLARAFNDDPRTRLVAVCDTNRQALETARAMFGDGIGYFHEQSGIAPFQWKKGRRGEDASPRSPQSADRPVQPPRQG